MIRAAFFKQTGGRFSAAFYSVDLAALELDGVASEKFEQWGAAMPKVTEGRFAIGALLIFSLWLFVGLPIYYGSTNSQASEACSNNKNEFWEKATCDPTAYFTGLLVAFTGVLAFSTIGLWFVTYKAARRQEEDTRILHRAYIAVEPAGVRPFESGPKILGYSSYRNVGNLTAKNVRYYSGIIFSNDRNRSDFPIVRPLWGNNVLAPHTHMVQATKTELSKEQEVAIRNRQGFIYVWGAVSYDDGFGNERHSYWCHTYDYRSVSITGQGTVLLAQEARHHEWGNGAD